MSDKIPIAILGATGTVGRAMAARLKQHPYFKLAAVCASERSLGLEVGGLPVQECVGELPCPLVFSALDSKIAGPIEAAYRSAGYAVVSNSKNHRMDSDVPLLVPEINADTLELCREQAERYNGGWIATNPNCSVIGLSMALAPLHRIFGVEAVHVCTMQALSGAGNSGPLAMDMLDNAIPFIDEEEAKIQRELPKILGSKIITSAQCNRVSVLHGHLLCVSVKLSQLASERSIQEAWRGFRAAPQELALPSAPKQALWFFEQANYPQPRLHRDLEDGMAVSIGRLQKCPLLDWKFVTLSHNAIRGAAGGAILLAELAYRRGLIPNHTVGFHGHR